MAVGGDQQWTRSAERQEGRVLPLWGPRPALGKTNQAVQQLRRHAACVRAPDALDGKMLAGTVWDRGGWWRQGSE